MIPVYNTHNLCRESHLCFLKFSKVSLASDILFKQLEAVRIPEKKLFIGSASR